MIRTRRRVEAGRRKGVALSRLSHLVQPCSLAKGIVVSVHCHSHVALFAYDSAVSAGVLCCDCQVSTAVAQRLILLRDRRDVATAPTSLLHTNTIPHLARNPFSGLSRMHSKYSNKSHFASPCIYHIFTLYSRLSRCCPLALSSRLPLSPYHLYARLHGSYPKHKSRDVHHYPRRPGSFTEEW